MLQIRAEMLPETVYYLSASFALDGFAVWSCVTKCLCILGSDPNKFAIPFYRLAIFH